MKKKLSSESGLTLVEMLCVTVVLILLGLVLNTGIQMAMSTYRAITAQSEVELLLSTVVDALTDDLRYAQSVSGSGESFTYRSDSFGENTSLTLDPAEGGQIKANGKRLLPTGSYGPNGDTYLVKPAAEGEKIVTCAVDAGTGEVTFTIKLKVETADGKISAQTPDGGVSVRCLNPPKKDVE